MRYKCQVSPTHATFVTVLRTEAFGKTWLTNWMVTHNADLYIANQAQRGQHAKLGT